jgi:sortase B
MAVYDTGVEAQWGDEFITLSTCDHYTPNGRLVVVAKRTDNR